MLSLNLKILQWQLSISRMRLEALWKRLRLSGRGFELFAKDKAPVIGYDEKQPNFFWNVGQGGYGIQTSPAWSELAANLGAWECCT